MSKDYTDQITCPYCEYEINDSSDYYDSDGSEVECPECSKTFYLTVVHEITYTTRRKDCIDDIHDFEEAQKLEYDQKTCDKYNRDKFLGRNDYKPHATWIRQCKSCDNKEFKDAPIDAENPFLIEQPIEG